MGRLVAAITVDGLGVSAIVVVRVTVDLVLDVDTVFVAVDVSLLKATRFSSCQVSESLQQRFCKDVVTPA